MATFIAARSDAAQAETLGAQIDNPLTPDAWMATPGVAAADRSAGRRLSLRHLDRRARIPARAPRGCALGRGAGAARVLRRSGCVTPASPSRRRSEIAARGCVASTSEGRLTALTAVPGGHALNQRPDGMTFESGGGGLWSTLDDYLAFARMLIAAGPDRRRPPSSRDARVDDVESADARSNAPRRACSDGRCSPRAMATGWASRS